MAESDRVKYWRSLLTISAKPLEVGAAPQREEYSAPPVFSQAGRARVERSGFLTECYCNCVGGLNPTA